jgi:hypothetical protein
MLIHGNLPAAGGEFSEIWELIQMKKRLLSVLLTFTLTAGLFPLSATASPDTASSWAREGIAAAISKGFIPEELQNNYTAVITRVEFCRMAVKWVEYALGKNIDTVLAEQGKSRDANAFTDTNDTDILAAFALGITSGRGGGLFDPDGQFTREQAAVMIMNTCFAVLAVDGRCCWYAPAHPTEMSLPFHDIDTAADWAHHGIGFVQEHGIMSGTGGNKFDPKALFTREQGIVTFNNIKYAHDRIPANTNSSWLEFRD